jgi:hypothetical protein
MTRRHLLVLNASLVLAWGALIWALGGADFSYHDTSRIIRPLLDWLFPAMDAGDKRFWLFFVRKCAHVSEYGVFAVLVLRLVLFLGGRRLAWNLGAAVAATLLLALLDEGRQGLLPNRTSSLRDVGLDVTGGAIGLTLTLTLATLFRRPLLGVPGWPGTAAASRSVLRQP